MARFTLERELHDEQQKLQLESSQTSYTDPPSQIPKRNSTENADERRHVDYKSKSNRQKQGPGKEASKGKGEVAANPSSSRFSS